MTEPQLQRAFVVLSFLVHCYVWCEDGAAEQVLPRTIAAPYWHVAKALGCEPVYTDAVIMWNMVGAGGDSTADPDLEEPFLREQRRLMPASQRRFVERFTAEPAVSLRAFFDAHPALDRGPYTRAVASLRAWRREHISLAGMYLVSFARELEGDPARGPPSKSPLHVVLLEVPVVRLAARGKDGAPALLRLRRPGFLDHERVHLDVRASISAAVTSSGASTGCKAVVRTAGRLRQDWRVAADEPKQKGLDDGKPAASRAGTATGGRSSTTSRAVKNDLGEGCEHETRKSPLQPSLHRG
ncbi:hypothetical protein EMIHUDRAFT_219364 [Emiliania huxleyi CCMP1516]|uniref:FERM domain-containing protein n=2 Tax=Emiliania huxleyi TaxID=2903 RepID=A0A0D3I5A8_EMIH1|nr:hypothetical protein EMIHUDRAFT_219364 [Emiliania huxleyi CCMP1516]EOD06443.1 hypothetical protein EMIHUDRAFT_219364 [Emiliania huxleyi CCMP1516]|eukprot:XP_005758872.1 hypothetical protein EMIHUDRAFT_219364 [Emiliania huxleyi CCMP1516]